MDCWMFVIVGVVSGTCIGILAVKATRVIPLMIITSAVANEPRDQGTRVMLARATDQVSLRWRGAMIVTTMVISVGFVCWRYNEIPLAVFAASLFTALLITLAWIDGETHLLPDVMTWPLLVVGLAFNVDGLFTTFESASTGTLAGYLAIRLSGVSYEWIANREGIGQGDAKLFAGLGAWLGIEALPQIFLLATGLALINELACRIGVQSDARRGAHPFGPYLAAAGIMSMLLR